MTIGELLRSISLETDERKRKKAAQEAKNVIEQHSEKKLLEEFLNCAMRGQTEYSVGRILIPNMEDEKIHFKVKGAGWVACW